jgi:hypothetical protein
MRFSIFIFVFIFFAVSVNAQTFDKTVEGNITFISSKNIYIKFASTDGISVGDTLYINNNGKLEPVLTVINLSSTSVLGNAIGNIGPTVSEKIFAKPKGNQNIKNIVKDDNSNVNPTDTSKADKKKKSDLPKQIISGRFSTSLYSNFTSTLVEKSTYMNYTFSLNVANINNSKYSTETYIAFRPDKNEWYKVNSNIFNALKIYNLSVKYELNKNSQIYFGRKINAQVAILGANDGLQYDAKYKNLLTGAIVGFRPDFRNYGFDAGLFQAAGYVGYNSDFNGRNMQNTLAFIDQTNQMKTDRRFLYFQHSNNLIKNLDIFYSAQMDLYKVVDSTSKNTVNLTSSYLSLRYRATNKLSLSTSYDYRKNAIYYQTYKDFPSLLTDQLPQQGYSLQANYNLKNIYFGVRTGYRFHTTDTKPSLNFNAYATINSIPTLDVSTTVSATYLTSVYSVGKVYEIDLTRNLLKGKMNIGLNYIYSNSVFSFQELKLFQNTGGIDIFWRIRKKLSLSANAETTIENSNKYYRIYFQICQRF